MSAGTFPAGSGPAGADPVSAPSFVHATALPAAAKFDLATRAFPFAADGQIVASDPIDQGVAIALGVALGGIHSSVDAGNGLRALKRGNDGQIAREATDIIRRALLFWTDRGDITVIDVRVAVPARGRAEVYVSYVNNRTNASNNMKSVI